MNEWHPKLQNSAMNVEMLLHYQISDFAVNVESRDCMSVRGQRLALAGQLEVTG